MGNDSRHLINRRQALALLTAGAASFASGCLGEKFALLGYTSRPNYDPGIRTVYVPIFTTKVFETTPYRGMEFELTRAVVNAIESQTTMKVVSDPDRADSELQGTITGLNKLLQNRTPFNEVRELELVLNCEIVWHDLRPGREGRVLTNPRKRSDVVPAVDAPFDDSNPPAPRGPDRPRPVLLVSSGRALPELGESSTSALTMAINRLAVKIISAMEEPW